MKSKACPFLELWDRDVVKGEGCEFCVGKTPDSDSESAGAERQCSVGSGRPFTVIAGTVEDAIMVEV